MITDTGITSVDYGQQGKYGGTFADMAGVLQQLGQLEQTRRQNQQINDFLDLTSKGIDPQTALVQIARKGTQFSGGLGGMFQRFSGAAGGIPQNDTGMLAPLIAQNVIRNAYGQTRERSNHFETFTGEDGKTHKGVFDNQGNMIRDMGIAPPTYGGKAAKSAVEVAYDRWKKIYDGESTDTARAKYAKKQMDKYSAKMAAESGDEPFQDLTDSPVGKKLQETQDIISDVENTDIEAAAKGIGGAGTRNATNINDPNAVINSAYSSGIINDEDLAAINDVLEQDPTKINQVIQMINEKSSKNGTVKQFSEMGDTEFDIRQPVSSYGQSTIQSGRGKVGVRMPFDTGGASTGRGVVMPFDKGGSSGKGVVMPYDIGNISGSPESSRSSGGNTGANRSPNSGGGGSTAEAGRQRVMGGSPNKIIGTQRAMGAYGDISEADINAMISAGATEKDFNALATGLGTAAAMGENAAKDDMPAYDPDRPELSRIVQQVIAKARKRAALRNAGYPEIEIEKMMGGDMGRSGDGQRGTFYGK